MKRRVARKSRKREDSKVADLEKRLAEALSREAEALEQQTATAEILRVISSSPTDLQPVFEALVKSAVRFCGADDALIQRIEGDRLLLVAHHGAIPTTPIGVGVVGPVGGTTAGRAVLERRAVHLADLQTETEEFPVGSALARRLGWHTVLSVPLLREGVPLGVVIVLRRAEVAPFSEKQIALLQTFADQAVIAIENVRLFGELQARNAQLAESLDQQTTTADILRIISTSPTDLQPVLDTVVESAARLCGSYDAMIAQMDGTTFGVTAHFGPLQTPASVAKPDPRSVVGRAFLFGQKFHVADLQAAAEEFPLGHTYARDLGFHTQLSIPLLREGTAIGVLTLRRAEVAPFTDAQIALLQTFADQAVIAIENVRLFTELQQKNEALSKAHSEVSESLEQQTATSDILRVISQSPTDVQPVFDTIAANARRLCNASSSAVFTFDGELIHVAALEHMSPQGAAFARSAFPMPPGRGSTAARAIMTRSIAQITEAGEDSEYALRDATEILEFQSVLAVPMLKGGDPIGAVSVGKAAAGPFREKQIALLKTFAAQAVIAIENVRLFTELQEKNRALESAHAQVTHALDKQMATSDILRVISRSQTDLRPVFEEILSSAIRLIGALAGALTRLRGDHLDLAAFKGTGNQGDATLKAAFPVSLQGRGLHSEAIRTRLPVNLGEAQDDTREPARSIARAVGYQSVVVVPMLHHEAAVGTISVVRREPGGFTEDEIALLQTFADQAVIAIENVRLLSELQARTEELSRSVEQLTALGEVGRAVSSTLDLETVLTTIVSRAVELSGLDGGVVFEYDEGTEEFVHRVATEVGGGLAEARRSTRVRKGEGVVGQTALTLEPAQVSDITVPGAYESRLRQNLIASGIRAVLAVPMVREGELIGCLVVSRNRPGEFTGDTMELLRTFATQSALAIQNARLFREIEIKSRELEAASRHKSEFLANMSHELRTPLNAIIGFSEVLSDRMFGELNAKQDEYLKDIHASGQHLLSLINDILDLSKIEAGRMELELTTFDVRQAIANAGMLVRERAVRRGIALHERIDERLGQIMADERKVKQVLLNLLSNAIKFTPEGGRIEVVAVPKDGLVEVSVSDTGAGIAPEDQEAVFEEFRQVGAAEKKAEGTGLGLTLCRKFVELHGGRIWVQSQVGVGSTFTFTIPVRRDE